VAPTAVLGGVVARDGLDERQPAAARLRGQRLGDAGVVADDCGDAAGP
jgi:hypothetical protein